MMYETCYQCGDSINTLWEPYREKYVEILPEIRPWAMPPEAPEMPKIVRAYAHERCAFGEPEWGYARQVTPRS
jgi:hypothetical protein